jgi:hypothetical protein
MNKSLLKIYASKYSDDPAAIIGNREGLQALRDALDHVLNSSLSTVQAFATQDLENSFAVHCRQMSDDEVLTYWDLLPNHEEDLDNLTQEETELLRKFVIDL